MEEVLFIKDMSKMLDKFNLGSINISLEAGYIMGLIGPNGAGKTTLIHTILGLLQRNEGVIKICGFDIASEERKAKDVIGFVVDESPFTESLSALENARAYGVFYSNWNESIFMNFAKRFELDVKKPLKKLSKGNKMKFQLAFALSHKPKLLVLDEPTSGLDPIFRKELMEILCDLVHEEELGILFSTHLTEDLDRLADYITFIKNGKQIFSMSKEEMLDAYGLYMGSLDELSQIDSSLIVGMKTGETYTKALIRRDVITLPEKIKLTRPTIEEIMYYTMSI